jgi:hypothetical protein
MMTAYPWDAGQQHSKKNAQLCCVVPTGLPSAFKSRAAVVSRCLQAMLQVLWQASAAAHHLAMVAGLA